ncbi:hypothetical protein AB0I22_38125 [Streptomyces sp. NPDC050610]|uniref:hypothetical protein n=1 Tax=Streptomyces sp. NPDC050610 TaxID=3157097 RepID=UPI003434EAA4
MDRSGVDAIDSKDTAPDWRAPQLSAAGLWSVNADDVSPPVEVISDRVAVTAVQPSPGS